MGLPMENDLLATTSEQIMEPESKFDTQNNFLSLTFQSINIVLIDHVICHVSIFSFILINFYHFTFEMTVHCI